MAATTAKRHEEYQYLDLVQEILDQGEHRPDRYLIRPCRHAFSPLG
jgi:hypothetical protein